MRHWMVVLLALGLFFTGAPLTPGAEGIRGAAASVAIEMSLDQLLEHSQMVAVGTPIEAHSAWEPAGNTGGRRIVTYSRFKIERLVDGHFEHDETWVRTLGGTVDGIGQRVFGAAELALNRPVILFLRARGDGTHAVVGMAQGEFPLEQTAEGIRRVRSSRRLGALVPPGSADATLAGAQRMLAGRPLEEVVNLVQTRRKAIGVAR